MSTKRKRSPDAEASTDVFRSAPVDDRSSTFIGFYSPTLKPKDLQKLPEIASASHKILAWRRESNQQSINKSTQYVTGSDDDGEKYGGRRVEKVLDATKTTGACVVARWYGGVMLGPVRFDHIETCAREAILQAEHHAKRVKLENEENVARKQLAESLAERDESIVALRALAQEKESLVRQHADPNGSTPNAPATVASPAKAGPNYGVMPFASLKALEKARDATIAFLLKRIDGAEAKLAIQPIPKEEPP